jgi:hypothetical protein
LSLRAGSDSAIAGHFFEVYYLGFSILTEEQAIMDALLSLPLFGYFLMPSLTTYSTSLNLLFFYMVCQTVSLE